VLKRNVVCLLTLAFCASAAACGSSGGSATPQDASTDVAASTSDAWSEGSAETGPEAGPYDASSPADGAPGDAASESGRVYLTDAVDLSLGSGLACAIRQTGTLVCWGSSSGGVPSEFQLPGDAGAAPSRVVVNFRTVCILDTQGGVWCLGNNYAGQLGSGAPSDLQPHLTPTAVVDGMGAPIRAVGLGGSFDATCAIREDGSVVCWGEDSSLQLGQDSGTFDDAGLQYSPVALPVPGVSFPGGILAKGWGGFACAGGEAGITCWGLNTQGECLEGASPTAFNTAAGNVLSGAGAALPARQLSLGYVHGCVLDAAGQVYCWGDNSAFERGTAQVAGSANGVTALADAGVSQIACGDGWTCALDSAAHVHCFGGNDFGELGNGTMGLPEAGVFTVLDVDGGVSLPGVARIYAGGSTSCAILGSKGSSAAGPVFCWGYPPDVGGASDAATGLPEPVLLP
jgi:hypothetical protein